MEINHHINVIAICGSLREGSTTHAALSVALTGAEEEGAEVELIDLRKYRAIFQSVDASDIPHEVLKLKAKVRRADGILLGTPEYHGSFSGVLKYTLDLMSYDEFENKVVGLVGVSGGRMGAVNALSMLRTVGASLRAFVIPTSVSIPQASDAFDANGNIHDLDIVERIKKVGREVTQIAALHNIRKKQRTNDSIT